MKKNIIQVLKSGNQELFYSSFIAWLLDAQGEHGLSSRFAAWFFQRIGETSVPVTVQTEKLLKSGRADIFIVTDNNRRIIVENKTKSIGLNEQIKKYEGDADIVVLLGFVVENFPAQERERVVTYKEILESLKSMQRSEGSLSVLVDHFIKFLESALVPFDTLRDFCSGNINLDEAKKRQPLISMLPAYGNDQRFFQAVYFEQLLTYISKNEPLLILGDSVSKKDSQKPCATKWMIEKNKQGPPYMEALVYSQIVPGKIRLKDKWAVLCTNETDSTLRLRLELWVGPDTFLTQENTGVFLLGCWDGGLKNIFRSSGIFNKKGGRNFRRNFHKRVLKIADLKYPSMAHIIIEEMRKVWDFEVNQQSVTRNVSQENK
jgi:hypothetical protein